jgi:hypothetical protein
MALDQAGESIETELAGPKTRRTSMIRKRSAFEAILLAFLACSSLCRAGEADGQRLLDAAKAGRLGEVQSLLDRGLSPKVKDEDGRTPLHLAVVGGHQAVAEALLRSGAEINALDSRGKSPLDLAEAAGHSALSAFLRSKGGKKTRDHADSDRGKTPPAQAPPDPDAPSALKPSLKFKTAAEFSKEIGEPAVLLESPNVCFFAPKRREKEAKIVLRYLVKAYEALYQIVGTHTQYKIAVCVYPKGNPRGWGGTSQCDIDYDESTLDLASQPEWTRYKVPHVSGYIEEMAHNFVDATKAQFGWEMIGWSIGAEVSLKVARNPILAANIRATRDGQKRTFAQYVKNGCVFPKDLPANQCDRIHAWILYQAATKYGPRFWPDFFREIRSRKQELFAAVHAGDGDKIRNARYRITLACFDRLPGLDFTKTLKARGISLTTDVKSLHPEAAGWDRRLIE